MDQEPCWVISLSFLSTEFPKPCIDSGIKAAMNSSHSFSRCSWKWIQRLQIYIGAHLKKRAIFFFWTGHFVAVTQKPLLHIDWLHLTNLCLSDSLIHTHMHMQIDARTHARMETVTNYAWKHLETFISSALLLQQFSISTRFRSNQYNVDCRPVSLAASRHHV